VTRSVIPPGYLRPALVSLPPSLLLPLAIALPLWLFLASRPLTTSFVKRNLLMTRPEIIPCSFSLASSSTVAFCSACYFSCPCSSSSWDFQRLSWSFVTGRLDIRSKCSSDSPCEFRLLSLFFFRVCFLHFLFLFRLFFLLRRLCRFLFLFYLPSACFTAVIDRNYSSLSLSSSSSAIASIGGVATEYSADPELIVSFGVCVACPLPAQVCILVLESHPHSVCRLQADQSRMHSVPTCFEAAIESEGTASFSRKELEHSHKIRNSK
jgi:hypothetical protein